MNASHVIITAASQARSAMPARASPNRVKSSPMNGRRHKALR